MEVAIVVNEIFSHVKLLNKENQLQLLEMIAHHLRRPEANGIKLTSISGIGSEVWGNVESIDKYIEEERKW